MRVAIASSMMWVAAHAAGCGDPIGDVTGQQQGGMTGGSPAVGTSSGVSQNMAGGGGAVGGAGGSIASAGSSNSAGGGSGGRTIGGGGAAGAMNGGLAGTGVMGGGTAGEPTSLGGAGGSDGGVGAGGGGAGGGGHGSGESFVPNLPIEWETPDQGENPGVEVLAFTIRQGGMYGPEWLVSLTNTFMYAFCGIDMKYTFYDASDNELASGQYLVDTPLHRVSFGAGGVIPCLGTGDVGMLMDPIVLQDVDVDAIARITYYLGGLTADDTVLTDDFQVLNLVPGPHDLGGTAFTGEVHNFSDAAVSNPSVEIYLLDEGGRPLFQTSAIEIVDIPAGGSWSFETFPGSEDAYASTMAFVDVSD